MTIVIIGFMIVLVINEITLYRVNSKLDELKKEEEKDV